MHMCFLWVDSFGNLIIIYILYYFSSILLENMDNYDVEYPVYF